MNFLESNRACSTPHVFPEGLPSIALDPLAPEQFKKVSKTE
jgi:hypothetical protein